MQGFKLEISWWKAIAAGVVAGLVGTRFDEPVGSYVAGFGSIAIFVILSMLKGRNKKKHVT